MNCFVESSIIALNLGYGFHTVTGMQIRFDMYRLLMTMD